MFSLIKSKGLIALLYRDASVSKAEQYMLMNTSTYSLAVLAKTIGTLQELSMSGSIVCVRKLVPKTLTRKTTRPNKPACLSSQMKSTQQSATIFSFSVYLFTCSAWIQQVLPSAH